jgi:hypothetical protein
MNDLTPRTLMEGYEIQTRQRDRIRELEEALAALKHWRAWAEPEATARADKQEARIRELEGLIEKIARCEIPSSNEFARRIQRWCEEALTPMERDSK